MKTKIFLSEMLPLHVHVIILDELQVVDEVLVPFNEVAGLGDDLPDVVALVNELYRPYLAF